ncbi:MAG: carbonic anhydrase [Planctomycetaceae bacterium]
MDYLLQGIHQFHTQVFQQEKEFFRRLADGQSPRVLFITCSDSRIDPALITQANPGELFVLRNAGNMVPPFGASNGGEPACVEYAVSVLGVEDIVVCGHSQCGALKALLDPASVESLPLIRDWLKHAESTRRVVTENYGELKGEALLEKAVQEHVLMQIENLQTHPSIASKLQRGELTLHGWVYGLATGNIHAYNSETGAFVPLGEELAKSGIPAPLRQRAKKKASRKKSAK